jgi:AcrR family transcriptional regulator
MESFMPKDTFHNLSEDKRERILDVAIEAFAEEDYHRVAVSHICERAGIPKGSFYQYFENKRELYFYLLELGGREKMAFLSGLEAPDPAMDLFVYLRWLFEAGVRFEFSHPRLVQVGCRAIYGDRPFGDEALERMGADTMGYYRGLVARAIDRGDLNPELDPEVGAFVLGTLLNHMGDFLFDRMGISREERARGEIPSLDLETARDAYSQIVRVLERGMSAGARPELGSGRRPKAERA